MAVKTFGIAHLYGVTGTVTNATVLSFSARESHINEDETTDESGHQIERRYDDEMEESTITLRLKATYTKPTIGDTLAYDSVTYEITSIDRNQEAKGYRTIVLNIKKSEFIAYS